MKRGYGDFPDCSICPKIPKGDPPHPDFAQELSKKNYKAYKHWEKCHAVGIYPDDEIVANNAAIIKRIYDQKQQEPVQNLIALLPFIANKNK